MQPWIRGLLTTTFASGVLALTACSGSSGGGNVGASSISDGEELALYLANDQGGDAGTIDRINTSSTFGSNLALSQANFDAGLAEGISLDSAGNLYQNGISGTGTVRAICDISTAPDGSAFSSPSIDRVITTALTAPKGSALAQNAGVSIVAESGGANALSVVSLTGGSAAAPLFTVTSVALGANAWDAAYDEDADRLFVALVNGDVAVMDSFLASSGVNITLFRPNNPLAATNMHGIVYDAANDRLVVSDVGSAADATDGSLYVFNSASTLTGTVAPDRTIRGPNSTLGNPVDLQLSGNTLLVAEKSNQALLRYANIFSGGSGDIAPDSSTATAAGSPPESIALAPRSFDANPDVTDLSGEPVNFLLATSNPANVGTTVSRVDLNLTVSGGLFTATQGGQFIENIMLDRNGDALVTFDDNGGGSPEGISFLNRLATRMTGGAINAPDQDRQIVGAGNTLVAPKGLDMAYTPWGSFVLVADFGSAAPGQIVALSPCGVDDATPAFSTTLPAGTRPWDLDYDPANDRLYVAATNGTVLVYDDYVGGTPGAATPDRIIDPNDQSGFPDTNLHGIVHDLANNRLILSDVGSAASATDGRIYVLDNASGANGLTNLRLEIAGPATTLGNPVDLAFDGSNLYVAEKANGGGVLLRYDNILTLTGGPLNRSPDRSLAFPAPESVVLSPDFLPSP